MTEKERSSNKKNDHIFNKVNFMGIDLTYEEARAVIFPAPYSSSRLTEGTLNAPSEILENWNMEDYDLELNYSPCAAKIYPLPEKIYEGEQGLQQIHDIVKQIMVEKKFPMVLGGDHAISIATVKAASEIYDDLSVFIIDAHIDLKDSFENNKNSNLSVTKRISEIGVDYVLLGTRSVGSEELDDAEKTDAYCKAYEDEIEQIIKKLNKNVYISIDVDAFDPSIMPSTPMPEPWGLKWEEVTGPLMRIAEKKNIVGCDITELSPINGFYAPTIMVAQLAYKIIGMKFKKQAEKEGWEECYETGKEKKK